MPEGGVPAVFQIAGRDSNLPSFRESGPSRTSGMPCGCPRMASRRRKRAHNVCREETVFCRLIISIDTTTTYGVVVPRSDGSLDGLGGGPAGGFPPARYSVGDASNRSWKARRKYESESKPTE
jgi:hypothetical protein